MPGSVDAANESSSQIAVVDDDPRIRHLLREELIDAGFQAQCYSDGFALLDEISTNPPDLILLDLMMPQLDGIECLRRIRQAKFTGPVVIFTALSDNEKRQEAEREGGSEYILKPDLFDNLERVINRHLTGKKV
jgi:DNA-binding response OmpR family regulator